MRNKLTYTIGMLYLKYKNIEVNEYILKHYDLNISSITTLKVFMNLS